jgi:hypothetical protein
MQQQAAAGWIFLNFRKLIAPNAAFCPAGFDGTFFYFRGKVGHLLRQERRLQI